MTWEESIGAKRMSLNEPWGEPLQYVQVRPVCEDGEGRDRSLIRAFTGDKVFAWGLYVTDADGLPIHEEDYTDRHAAISVGLVRAKELGVPLSIDNLDGSTEWRDA